MEWRLGSALACGGLIVASAVAYAQQPAQLAAGAPPGQKHGDHHELRITGVRTTKTWIMSPGGARSATIEHKAGEILLVVAFAARDLRSDKDDPSLSVWHFEAEDRGGTKYASPLDTTHESLYLVAAPLGWHAREVAFSVPDPAAIRYVRIASHTFDIGALTKELVAR